MCERVAAAAAKIRQQADADDALLSPMADRAAVVIVGHDHGRGKAARVGIHDIHDIAVVAVAQILDEHRLIDARPLHVEQQGFDRLVLVQADMAVGVDDGVRSLVHADRSLQVQLRSIVKLNASYVGSAPRPGPLGKTK